MLGQFTHVSSKSGALNVLILVLALVPGQTTCRAQEENILSAQNPTELGQLFRKHFDSAAEIHTGLQSQSNVIAIQCAWKTCRNRIWESGLPKQERQHVSWFLGWLEGRLGFSPPPEWCELMSSAKLTWSHAFGDAVNVSPQGGWSFYKRRHNNWFTRSNLDLYPKDNQLIVVSSKGNEITVPRVIVEFSNEEYFHKVVELFEVDDRFAIITIRSLTAGQSEIYKIDKQQGQVVWGESVFQGSYPTPVAGGSVLHLQSMVVNSSNEVTVFGCGLNMAYAEAFDLETGSPIWRFSTNY